MRIDRMLSIVVILLNRRKITAKELSDRFEVSLRTIYRDIEAINMAGIPVISNQGTDGGYAIPDNYKLNKQYVSITDLRSILSALKGVNAALNDNDIEAIFEKVQSLLPEHGKGIKDRENEIIVFDTKAWGKHDKTAGKIQQIYDAIKTGHLIEFRYKDNQGNASHRMIEPMTLIQKGFSWYLFGFCKERDATRLFKLTRMKQIIVSSQTFERKKVHYEKSMDKQWEAAVKQIDVVLKFSANAIHMVEDYHEDARVLERDHESITIGAKFPEGEWLYGMILSYGSSIEVLSPVTLRKKIKNRIKQMAWVYKT